MPPWSQSTKKAQPVNLFRAKRQDQCKDFWSGLPPGEAEFISDCSHEFGGKLRHEVSQKSCWGLLRTVEDMPSATRCHKMPQDATRCERSNESEKEHFNCLTPSETLWNVVKDLTLWNIVKASLKPFENPAVPHRLRRSGLWLWGPGRTACDLTTSGRNSSNSSNSISNVTLCRV